MDRFRCGIHPGEVPFCAHGVRAIWQGSSQRLRLVPRRARGPPRRQGRALVPHCTVAGVMRPPTTAPPTDFFAELLARPSIRADTSQGRHIAKGAALHAAKRLRMSDDELRAGLSKLSNRSLWSKHPNSPWAASKVPAQIPFLEIENPGILGFLLSLQRLRGTEGLSAGKKVFSPNSHLRIMILINPKP